MIKILEDCRRKLEQFLPLKVGFLISRKQTNQEELEECSTGVSESLRMILMSPTNQGTVA